MGHEQAITKVPFKIRVPELCKRWADEPLVIFTCQYSAHRAPQCANWYREQAHPRQQVGILSGGFRGWESVGLPVEAHITGDKSGESDSLAMVLGMDFVKQAKSEALEGNEDGNKCDGKLSMSQTGTHVTTSNHATTPSSTVQSLAHSEAPSSAVVDPVGQEQVAPLLTTPPTLENHKPSTLQSAANDACNSNEAVDVTGAGSVVTSVSLSTTTNRLNYVEPELTNRVPTIKNVEHIDPVEVQELMECKRCVLVDVRGEDRAAGIIEGSVHEPAIDSEGFVSFPTKVSELVQKWKDESLIIFTCQYSAHRAPQCANWYREKAPPQQRVAIMSMGFRGWEGLGFPVQEAAPITLARTTDTVAQQLGRKFVTGCLTAPNLLPTLQTALRGEEELAPQTGGVQEVTETIASSSNSRPSHNQLSDSQHFDNPITDTQPSDDQATLNGNAFKTNYVPSLLPNRVPTIENVE